jgi:hypothetical protein
MDGEHKGPGVLITAILGRGKGSSPKAATEDQADAEPAGEDEGLQSAAEDMLAAIKGEDAKALAAAVKAAVTCCGED